MPLITSFFLFLCDLELREANLTRGSVPLEDVGIGGRVDVCLDTR